VVSSNLSTWGAVLVAAGATILLLAGERLIELPGRFEARVGGHPYGGFQCPSKAGTGRPCVGCGGTTALVLARRGRVLESARANAFGLASAAGLAFVAVGAWVCAFSRRTRALIVATSVGGGMVVFGFLVQCVRWWAGSFN
jgi:hypothetical protein